MSLVEAFTVTNNAQYVIEQPLTTDTAALFEMSSWLELLGEGVPEEDPYVPDMGGEETPSRGS